MIEVIRPDWPAPARVRALSTTRLGGFSLPPYDSLNLGDHVADAPQTVEKNRQLLVEQLALPSSPHWLEQVHSCEVVDAARGGQADAAISRSSGSVCAVMTADCLPLLLCDYQGRCVAAVHAGWRGLLNGVIEAALEKMALPAEEILAWMGPAIGPTAFEVGDEVFHAFTQRDPTAALHFKEHRPGHKLADIYGLARQRLMAKGVAFIGGGQYCTVSDPTRFFSYRRDGVTGRMATLIWLEN
ncbi:MAG: peptidoglycan editing factor PgeF [Candidatus Polarisedimenticolaceae bacterium]|nr:peptidoglycan editing factor PgeF [Candidatus Polarisedimenticolaceae bacterium]